MRKSKILNSKTRRKIKAAYRVFMLANKRIYEVITKLAKVAFSRRNRRRLKSALKRLLKTIKRSLKLAGKFILPRVKHTDRAILRYLKK
jgi:uncharacterized membrane protein